MEQIKYIARRPFKYDGKWFKQGEEWIPVGGRYDASIIRNRIVTTVRVETPEAEPAPVTKRAAKSK